MGTIYDDFYSINQIAAKWDISLPTIRENAKVGNWRRLKRSQKIYYFKQDVDAFYGNEWASAFNICQSLNCTLHFINKVIRENNISKRRIKKSYVVYSKKEILDLFTCINGKYYLKSACKNDEGLEREWIPFSQVIKILSLKKTVIYELTKEYNLTKKVVNRITYYKRKEIIELLKTISNKDYYRLFQKQQKVLRKH
jgi:hypothetical protein